MAEEQIKKPEKKVKKGGKKKFLLLLILAVPLLIIAVLLGSFLYVTSDSFLQSQILPKVNEQLGGEVKVAKSKIKPFSQFAFDEVSVRSLKKDGLDPVFQVKQIDLQYDLMKLLSGKELNVSKFLVDSPRIVLKTFSDESSNFEFNGAPSEETDVPESDSSAQPIDININNIEIKNAYVLIESQQPDGSWSRQEIDGFNFSIDQLGGGRKGTIKISASSILNESGADKLIAALGGQFNIEMADDLAPSNIGGSIKVDVSEASGQLADLKDVAIGLDLALQPQKLENLSLSIVRGGNLLGKILATGPFDPEKGSADLTLTADQINKSVLNLLAVGTGGDFGRTSLTLKTQYQASENWSVHKVDGTLNGSSVEWIADGKATPATDLTAAFKADVDTGKSTALIPLLDIRATQSGREVIKAAIDNPLTVNYGSDKPTFSDAVLGVDITNFSLGSWTAALAPDVPAGGLLNSKMAITSRSNGQDISITMDTSVNGFEMAADGRRTPQADIRMAFNSQINMATSTALIPQLTLFMNQSGSEVIKATLDQALTVNFGGTTPQLSDTALNLVISAFDLNQWTSVLTPESPLYGRLSSTLALASRSNGNNLTLNLNSTINGFSNGDTTSPIHNTTINLTSQGSVTNFKGIDLSQLNLGVNRANGPLLTSVGTLRYTESGQIALKNSIRLFDANKPGDSESVDLNADVQVTPEAVNINSVTLAMKPTVKVPQNQLTLTGKLPGTENPDMAGSLSGISPGLDVTRVMAFYNSLTPKSDNKKKKDPEPASKPQVEPPPMDLPYKNLTALVKAEKLVVDKLTIDQTDINVVIDNGKITADPINMALLGAPIRAKAFADVSIPGYQYNFNLDLGNMPLSTFLSSLGQEVDDKKHGGKFDFNLGLQGKGVTDMSIKQNLRANTKLNLTGGNLAISGGFKKYVIMPIATVLRLDPILDGVVDRINLDAEFGSGAFAIKDLLVGTEPFIISTQGSVGVNDDIASTEYRLPLTMSLKREIAKSANFLPRDTPETQEYVPLPDFVSLAGTLSGTPGVKINEARIAQMLLQSAAGLPGETLNNAVEIIQDPAGSVGNVINNVGGLIPGIGKKDGSNTNALPRDPTKLLKGLFDR